MEENLVEERVKNISCATSTGLYCNKNSLHFTCSCCRCINGKDFRAQQCENEFFIAAPGNRAEAGQQNWIPFEHTDNEFKCKLACYNRDTKVKKNILNF